MAHFSTTDKNALQVIARGGSEEKWKSLAKADVEKNQQRLIEQSLNKPTEKRRCSIRCHQNGKSQTIYSRVFQTK